ncbi:hypothetical protein EDD18DRAFT_1348723 [Armillaria luteobubalina]|uniref:Uncharacterized protein n=1 Tax=Armillaria luteobubalina TaxID=153913 RepID=A0AA39UZX0_9AGAR|nr:hypothetical protein EDD18DRAFT_1348723 [Armillaria luteobubalina]
MGEPVVRQDPASLCAESDLRYVEAALHLEDLVKSPPPRRHSHKIDAWLRDALVFWEVCCNNRKPAGIVKAVFHKLEYSVIMAVSNINPDWVKKSSSAYNELGWRGNAYEVDITPIPNDLDSSSEEDFDVEDTNKAPEDEKEESEQRDVEKDEGSGDNDHEETIVTVTSTRPSIVSTAGASPIRPAVGISDTHNLPASSSRNSSFVQQMLETNPVLLPVSPSKLPSSVPTISTVVMDTEPFPGLSTTISPQKGLVLVMKPHPRMITNHPRVPTAEVSVVPSNISGSTSFDLWFIPDPESPLHRKQVSPFKTGPPVSAKKSPKKVYGLRTVNAASRLQILPGPDPLQQEERSLSESFPVDEGPINSSAIPTKQGEGVSTASFQVSTGISPSLMDNLIDFEEDVLPPPPVQESLDDGDGPPSPQDDEVMNLELTIEQPTTVGVPSPPPRQPLLTEELLENIHHPHRARWSPPSRSAPKNPKPLANPIKKRLQKLAQDKEHRRLQEEAQNSVDSTTTKKHRAPPVSVDTIEEPILKKPRMLVPSENDEVRPTPAVRKRGPGPTKLPLVALGVGGGGFGEVPKGVFKAVVNGITHIGVLEVEADYGQFVRVDGRLWNKDVAAFVGEWYSQPLFFFAESAPGLDSSFRVMEECALSITSKTRQFMAGLDVLNDANAILQQLSRLRSDSPSTSRVTILQDDLNVDDEDSVNDLEDSAGPSGEQSSTSN